MFFFGYFLQIGAEIVYSVSKGKPIRYILSFISPCIIQVRNIPTSPIYSSLFCFLYSIPFHSPHSRLLVCSWDQLIWERLLRNHPTLDCLGGTTSTIQRDQPYPPLPFKICICGYLEISSCICCWLSISITCYQVSQRMYQYSANQSINRLRLIHVLQYSFISLSIL